MIFFEASWMFWNKMLRYFWETEALKQLKYQDLGVVVLEGQYLEELEMKLWMKGGILLFWLYAHEQSVCVCRIHPNPRRWRWARTWNSASFGSESIYKWARFLHCLIIELVMFTLKLWLMQRSWSFHSSLDLNDLWFFVRWLSYAVKAAIRYCIEFVRKYTWLCTIIERV